MTTSRNRVDERAPWQPFRLVALALIWLAMLAGCSNGGEQAPAGLSYAMPSAVYQTGAPIVPNRPSSSGGPVERYSVTPALPAGLTLDPVTGIIAGTPSAASPASVYVVRAENSGGSATTRLEIEVRSDVAAPAGLSYRDQAVTYTVGLAINANTPTSSGGPITGYSISPALPAGLAIDAQTGVISGTPTAIAADAAYVVTGNNAAGSTTVTLRIAVQAAPVAPATVSYTTASPLYVVGEAIVTNTPTVTGGMATGFSVTPALPAGLSINASTGVISGTPTAIQSQALYTVLASNNTGSAQTDLRITVTSRGTWTTATPMLVPVHYLTATALVGGRVLQAGGFGAGGPIASASLYDPTANTWTATGSMTTVRSGHTATRLNDGRVLVAGGSTGVSAQVATVEIYDPPTGTWTAAASMSVPREGHSATLLADGRVLVIGGFTSGTATVASVEVYNPLSNTWTTMATPLAAPRGQHAAALLPGDNYVLVAGGISGTSPSTTVELYPVNDVGPSTTHPFPGAGSNVSEAVRLPNGKVLVIGDGEARSWTYDPGTSTWASSAMAALRFLPAMQLLSDGRVLVAGGGSAGGVRLASAEVYNPDVNVWTAATSMSVGRNAAASALLPDGSALIIGGFDGAGEVYATERYSP